MVLVWSGGWWLGHRHVGELKPAGLSGTGHGERRGNSRMGAPPPKFWPRAWVDEGAVYGYGRPDLGRISRVGFGSQFDGGTHWTLG